MNRKIALSLVLAAAAAGNAFADDITLDPPFVSTLSRAEVQAELQQARADDSLSALNGEDSGSAWLASRDPQQPDAQTASLPAAAE